MAAADRLHGEQRREPGESHEQLLRLRLVHVAGQIGQRLEDELVAWDVEAHKQLQLRSAPPWAQGSAQG